MAFTTCPTWTGVRVFALYFTGFTPFLGIVERAGKVGKQDPQTQGRENADRARQKVKGVVLDGSDGPQHDEEHDEGDHAAHGFEFRHLSHPPPQI